MIPFEMGEAEAEMGEFFYREAIDHGSPSCKITEHREFVVLGRE